MARILAQEGNLTVVDFGHPGEPLLTKLHLSRHPSIKRSTRWIEQRVAEGMPSTLDGNRRIFRLSEVQNWLESQGRKAANG